MSSITTAEAQALSVPDIAAGYSTSDEVVDQFFEKLPLEPIAGHAKRINVVEASTIYNLASLVTTGGGSVSASQPTYTVRESPVARFAARLAIDSLLVDEYSSHRDLVLAQLKLKVRAILSLAKRYLVLGDSVNTGEFDGLLKLGDGNKFGADGNAANGGTVQKGEVETLISMLSPGDGNRGRVLVMAPEAFGHLYRNNYSQHIGMMTDPDLGPVPSILGVPILLNGNVPTDQTKGGGTSLTTICAVNLGRERGLCGLCLSKDEGRQIQIRGPFPLESQDTLAYDVDFHFGVTTYRSPAVAAMDGVAHTQ